MTEKRFEELKGYKRFDSYFDDFMQLWTVSDNENDNMLYPCTSENMANEFCNLLNELHEENQKLKKKIDDNMEEKNEQLKLSNRLLFEKMKEKIPNHPKLQRDLEYLMNEGMSREEALNMMIIAWLCK